MAEVVALPLPHSVPGESDSLRLLHAEGSRDIAAVRRFRFLTYLHRSDMVVDDSVAVDERSHLFALLAQDEIVACARVLPLPDDAAGINQFDHKAISAQAAPTEVGRLAVSARRSPLLILALLGLGAHWMVEHTRHERFLAYCDRRLVPAYQRVGAEDLGIELPRPGRSRPYRFVTGRFDVAAEQAMSLLAEFGGDKRSASRPHDRPRERSTA
jgi:predicted GNAT family N-acyltransferase